MTENSKALFFIAFEEKLLDINDFKFACLLNDVYLKDYRYSYNEDTGHIWLPINSATPLASCLRAKDIRLFIMNDVFEWLSKFYRNLLEEISKCNNSSEDLKISFSYESLIKKIEVPSLGISGGDWYLKFIDCVSKL